MREREREREQMLRKIHGNDNVDKKFQDLVDVYEAAKKAEHPWRKSCNQDPRVW